jgi:hypothetical protein
MEFTTLALRAAYARDPNTANPLFAWLDALKDYSPSTLKVVDKSRDTGALTPDGKEVRWVAGELHNLCTASADFCKGLEIAAILAEGAVRKQNLTQVGKATGTATASDENPNAEDRERAQPEPCAPMTPGGVGPNINGRKAERKKLRDDYKAECKQSGVKVTDEMIAEAANPRWHSRANIQKWLACDPKYDGVPDGKIRKVFRDKPHLPKNQPTKHQQ